jgi:hypothetical protein
VAAVPGLIAEVSKLRSGYAYEQAAFALNQHVTPLNGGALFAIGVLAGWTLAVKAAHRRPRKVPVVA